MPTPRPTFAPVDKPAFASEDAVEIEASVGVIDEVVDFVVDVELDVKSSNGQRPQVTVRMRQRTREL